MLESRCRAYFKVQCIHLDIMLVNMHYALFISHYAGFGTHSKLSNFWEASDSLWVVTLIGPVSATVTKKYRKMRQIPLEK